MMVKGDETEMTQVEVDECLCAEVETDGPA
jgi:hypothetical protein